MALPDFLVIGAPKAGSTAVHAALTGHPQLFLSTPKEPKFFLSDGTPPPRERHRGPGDGHSRQEWVWKREDYERLFDAAPPGVLKGESTPFYLWDREAHVRIARALPDVRLVAVVRDPVDRAYSNWVHLRSDGLEPEADFLTACRLEEQRAAAGWAPFWRYLELGRYGEQLAHLFEHVDRERVHVIRYRELVDAPARTLDGIAAFLGVATGVVTTVPASNTHGWADDTPTNSALRRAIRAGAHAGRHLPPQAWRRRLERPLVRALQRGDEPRPRLSPAVRRQLLPAFDRDVHRLQDLLDRPFDDWLSDAGRGSFSARR
ncbi:sulfotransferase family protein [Lapillicoccus jejuensis]|nr:sulfotransferase [Lapillicoccus jejuensis]